MDILCFKKIISAILKKLYISVNREFDLSDSWYPDAIDRMSFSVYHCKIRGPNFMALGVAYFDWGGNDQFERHGFISLSIADTSALGLLPEDHCSLKNISPVINDMIPALVIWCHPWV